MCWASSEKIVNGYTDKTFRPNAPITREQMATILYNYASYKGYDVSGRANLSGPDGGPGALGTAPEGQKGGLGEVHGLHEAG